MVVILFFVIVSEEYTLDNIYERNGMCLGTLCIVLGTDHMMKVWCSLSWWVLWMDGVREILEFHYCLTYMLDNYE